MSRLGEEFKEYMGNIMKAEIKRLEELLKNDKRWSPSERDLKTYKALESQRGNLLEQRK